MPGLTELLHRYEATLAAALGPRRPSGSSALARATPRL